MDKFEDWTPVQLGTVLPVGVYDIKVLDDNGRSEYLTEVRQTVMATVSAVQLDIVLTAMFGHPVIAGSAKIVPLLSSEEVTVSAKDYDILIALATLGANQGSRVDRQMKNQDLFRIVSGVRRES
jgi:3D (Asp-Asp-Asp) domain-containing protein